MNTEQALNVLINAVQAANLKGAFALQDSAVIAQAVAVFVKPTPKVEETKEEVKE